MQITLVIAAETPMPDQPDRLGRALLTRLQRMGVEIVTQGNGHDFTAGQGARDGPLVLSDGRIVAVDLVLPALGLWWLLRGADSTR